MKTLLLIVGMVVGVFGFVAPKTAQALGVCGHFCRSQTIGASGGRVYKIAPSMGSSACTTATACGSQSAPECPDRYTVTMTEAREFCRAARATLTPADFAESQTWCRQFSSDQYLENGEGTRFCRVTAEDGQRARESTSLIISNTPAPQPASPGDAFRCRYACRGDVQVVDGAVCSNANDQDTCLRQCITACGAPTATTGCSGLTSSNQPDPALPQAHPRCIAVATASSTAPAPSVGGITDTGRFESLNESFTSVSVVGFIGGAIKVLIGIAGSVFFLFMVWGGIRWMMAGGDPGEVSAAKSTIQNAMIGVILLALSYTIVTAFLSIATNFVPAATRSSPVTGERPPAR